jgi:hypothetical protein
VPVCGAGPSGCGRTALAAGAAEGDEGAVGRGETGRSSRARRRTSRAAGGACDLEMQGASRELSPVGLLMPMLKRG